jgi:predicted lactoylglutathione lyase
MPARKIFVNIRVRDLPASKAFFAKLGFEFNAQFTNDDAACMVLSEEGYVMLLSPAHWTRFTKKEPCNTRTHTEALLALSCESREEVDRMMAIALESGGKPAVEPEDHGFMYGRSFYDLDEHHWEVFWMDPAALSK